jgi:hypothetical protein
VTALLAGHWQQIVLVALLRVETMRDDHLCARAMAGQMPTITSCALEPSHVAVRIDPTQMPAFAHGLSLEIVAKLTL